ncbi:MAG: hypothetical protein [Microviridae sp.]|nr:MAG: hypothetical protein [Microviridae sp.]
MRTMRFKSQSIPAISKGRGDTGPSETVPNQSMSLQYIIERFTRGEAVPVGKEPQYHESDDDLEKVSHMDLVDKQEFVEKLKSTQKDFEKQEKNRQKKEKERLDKMAVDKIAADKLAAEQAAKDVAK